MRGFLIDLEFDFDFDEQIEDRQRKGKPLPVVPIETLPVHLEGGKPLAAIDLGDKTIGLAVSDRGLSFAHPRKVIARKKFSIDVTILIADLAREGVGALVVGLPINMDGSSGPRVQSTRAFVRNMDRLTDMPVVFWDERLSTVAVERTLIEMDFSRARRKTKIDSAAAAFILQGVLDRLQVLGDASAGEDDGRA